ncbi:MAG TPA: hypothetical protein VFT50_09390 [Baekduia sp.]|nr:hypothetical protein [Baekduia sp.]
MSRGIRRPRANWGNPSAHSIGPTIAAGSGMANGFFNAKGQYAGPRPAVPVVRQDLVDLAVKQGVMPANTPVHIAGQATPTAFRQDMIDAAYGRANAPAAVAPPAAARATPAPSPFDSNYNADVARLMFNNKQAHGAIDLEGTQDQQDFDTTLARMARARDEDLHSANVGANQEGLFYSGQLTKRRGNIEHDYGDRMSDAQTAFDRRAQARRAALDQLGSFAADESTPIGYAATGQAGLDLTDVVNAAIGRRLAANQDAPVDPGPPPPPPPPKPAPMPVATTQHRQRSRRKPRRK